MKIHPNDPAHPCLILGDDAKLEAQHTGMPIRLAIAAQILAARCVEGTLGSPYFVMDALAGADALIKAYNESEG